MISAPVDSGARADWDAYWRGMVSATAPAEGGAQLPVLRAFWQQELKRFFPGRRDASMIDIACGDGAVTRLAIAVADSSGCTLSPVCTDISPAAVERLCNDFDSVHGIVADAARLPMPDASVDLAVSQFGLEYAGVEAFGEAARLVRTGGELIALVHRHGSAIDRECGEVADALQAFAATELLDRARSAFAAGFSLNRGNGSREAFRGAANEMTPAARAVEAMLTANPQLAGGMARLIYTDIRRIFERLHAHVEEDVMPWLERMSAELAAYAGRMASMQNAAMNDEQVAEVVTTLERRGLVVDECRPLMQADGADLALILRAVRP